MIMEKRRASFTDPKSSRRPIYYFTLPSLAAPDWESTLSREAEKCRSCGCSTIIPRLEPATVLDRTSLEQLRQMYVCLLEKARELGLTVGFFLDPALEQLVVREDPLLRSMTLERKEYICSSGERLERKLQKGERLALIAFSEEYNEILDLRPFCDGEKLCWQVPKGNYVVHDYLLLPEKTRDAANRLSYDTSLAFVKAVLALFDDIFAPYWGSTLTALSYSEISFDAPNRRNWDPSFNAVFEARFGFDPSLYYPALFGYVGAKTEHMKALFMSVRASLLQNGILRALSDVAEKRGLLLFGTLSEPKLSACSLPLGDAMLGNAFSPCALFDKAYMYGTNSIKIAAGAAYNFDVEQVGAELFLNYTRHDSDLLYKDAMNAFARGVNSTALHLTGDVTENSDFCDFAARAQSLLRGGRHVADIAMLYPIYHLHANANLYFSPVEGYEYPATPPDADYMTLINSISIYSGHDLTLLHPETLSGKCHTEGGVLYLNNERNKEAFRIVVLPSTHMISLDNLRLLKRFYDEGGKILSIGVLPTVAFEYDERGENDREVCRLTEEIFGHEACNPLIMRDFCHNQNDAGGESFFLYFNASSMDGTRMTRSSTVNEALNSFGIPFDVYLPGMPRMESTGGLNTIYPEFRAIGLHRVIPGGGMLNHIHKHHEDCEVYYFSNTTNEEYNHHVLLRGAFDVEEWDPHSGKTCERKSKLLSYRGHTYTNLRLTLPSRTSTFFIASPREVGDATVEVIDSIHNLQSEHAALMSEF